MTSPIPVRALPGNPDLQHLKNQARDLVRAGSAVKLSQGQFLLAREYGFPSWPKLKQHVESLSRAGELKAAIDANDLAAVRGLMTRHPDLHTATIGYNNNGPLTWVAECRVPRVPPDSQRLAIALWMLENGSDVHQGGDGPLMRAALDDMRIPMMELLVAHGADVNAQWSGYYPIICAPCETLAPGALRWLIDHGADPRQTSSKYGSPLSMVVGAYCRDPKGKHACLEVFADAQLPVPDTTAMAFHRGRIDLLEVALSNDPTLLHRRFPHHEVFPKELGFGPGDGAQLTTADGGTLLHLAMEYDEMKIARWLLESGADPNARADVDKEGFGGHTPLFHAVVTFGNRDAAKTKLLLKHGADPTIRATLRKQISDVGDPNLERMAEFHNVTAVEYARQFQVQRWVSDAGVAAIEGGLNR